MLHSSNRPSEPPADLSLPEAYHMLAALMQFPAMFLLSLAIYMRNWVCLKPDNSLPGPQPFALYTFGLPYRLDTSRNTSEYFFQTDRHPLRLIAIMVCYLSLFFGVTAFLLDCLGLPVLERHRSTLVSSFHIFSGISTLVLVAICVWCFEKS
ncbi:uncharacterized protein LOC116512982 isoform X2 [Thamnophis elegans]|uniref:uncharacterized protein LOC116512982 isoform X2 n=1 Tax=Thamnophis elegans TaxID=35005 RepID=UPI001378CE8A|nr:uncharacterized protein LOC116512982 isoform X2 [Thamnophis elegans]